jgi:dihydropteroate synthase
MQKNPVYRDVVGDILSYFRGAVGLMPGIAVFTEDRLLIDPGFGFGKTDQHNLSPFCGELWQLKVLGKPIVSGPSRKSTLGRLLGWLPPEAKSRGDRGRSDCLGTQGMLILSAFTMFKAWCVW